MLEAEIFDPASGKWTPQSQEMAQPRMYHSCALLLPDGRVVASGGTGQPSAQIFKPPYITSSAPRPIIVSAPSSMQYDEQYSITYQTNGGPPVSKACLIRLGTVTHGFDQSQRYVPLSVTRVNANEPTILVDAPINSNIAPPGYYMLFILNEYARNEFAPCTMARYVQVGP